LRNGLPQHDNAALAGKLNRRSNSQAIRTRRVSVFRLSFVRLEIKIDNHTSRGVARYQAARREVAEVSHLSLSLARARADVQDRWPAIFD
jgi:hypothetical protein